MSHFTVMVIGDNPEEQLAPYHEFECTDKDDEYVVEVDITEESWRDYIKYGKGRLFVDFITGWLSVELIPYGFAPDLEGDHKYGYALLNHLGDVEKVVRRTNPNKKWDWYQLGGRWNGYFKLKGGVIDYTVGSPGLMTPTATNGRADQCRVKDIDVEGMQRAAIEEAEFNWMAAKDKSDIDRYWQHGIKEGQTYEQYINCRTQSFLSTFAVVKDGEWFEKGEMGWWGIVFDEKDRDTWDAKFFELFNSLDPDTLVSVYDCHI